MEQRIKENDEENKEHRRVVEIVPASDTMVDLIPEVKDEDMLDDTGADTIVLDVGANPKASELRMFTLKQMNQLFNIKLRRSDVRKRLDVNDEDTVVL